MLKSIYCEKFRIKTISFNSGLNVVAGDDRATNSIGKSTLLMVIDFIMGGSDLLVHNHDVVDELGHHDYRASFEFPGSLYFFRRDTGMADVVHQCNEDWEVLEAMTLENYKAKLAQLYRIDDLGLTFRGMCAPFSRIWGKSNLNPKRPLDAHSNQSASDSIDLTLKMYGKYGEVEELESSLKAVKAKAQALTSAFRQSVIPKIGKKKYKENEARIQDSANELASIRSDLALYATNLRELANKEVAEIKSAKDELLNARFRVLNRLSRVSSSLRESKHIQSKSFVVLQKYFTNLESEKLATVEEFHSDIAKILRHEIKQSERSLKEELERIDGAVAQLDERLREILSNVENPGLIVDRVYDLSKNVRSLQMENDYFDQNRNLSNSAGDLKNSLDEKRLLALSTISKLLNEKLAELAARIYKNSQKSPYLSFSPTNYEYRIFEDTGTGKAYGNLILFDLAVLSTTPLPFLIHDSLLFKNIENQAVENMVGEYAEFDKQSFIAIDEIGKYSKKTQDIVNAALSVRLSNESVLYIKDWRRRE